ncbi:MAG: hypothetical protein HN981_01920 [Candidatus Pacebacteria bacterium]|jgi:methionyl-tRNA formyltransferase|nr:hypothetical protein [Candidatus Paceibacterota bacterium]MBT4652763.1 hypothetical protein [Candidatus Paceibacterota bacterium]MBT6755920.1 hypothetical protein [Candidatus Paceibacterota bacterium]MBT6921133.1 hypothetical protein [Candidatus Paceibacterota bacterium]
MTTIWIAGSTHRTTQVAKTLHQDSRFSVTHIITPSPRKIGRKQEEKNNPLHQFALDNKITTTLVDKKIDSSIKEKLEKVKKPDILIVVDFGFLIPSWLLDLPKIAPLNIHPSLLPRWRGSTPGPSVLLHGDKKSAVTLMIMNEKMDEGPILSQIPFTVDPTWTQTEYYQTSFDLICEKLGDHIEQFLQKKIIPSIQPTKSPTPTALKLTKEKAFISWNEIKNAMQNGEKATEIERASRAFYPWPKLWTKVITNKGKKRFIIHSCFIDEKKHLQLDKVQLEGKSINNWSEIKNSVLE